MRVPEPRPMRRASTTQRECHVCGAPAFNVDGRFFLLDKLIRLWACDEHHCGDPTRTVETPEWAQRIIDTDTRRREAWRKHYTQDVEPERSESIKYLAPTGWGEPIPSPGRAHSFRWGETPGDVADPRPLPIDPRTMMIMRVTALERGMK